MIRLKTSISVLDKFLSLNNIRGVMINSLVNFKILELLMKAAGYDQVDYMFKQNGNSLGRKFKKINRRI